jgi:photosystem I subunit V
MSGLKPTLALRTQRVQTRKVAMPKVAARGHKQVTKAFDDVNLTVTVINGACLVLGRFAFLPYQRAQIAKAGLPVQNGLTYEAAGDKYAKEASFLTATNDPAGFSLIDGEYDWLVGLAFKQFSCTLYGFVHNFVLSSTHLICFHLDEPKPQSPRTFVRGGLVKYFGTNNSPPRLSLRDHCLKENA